MSSFTVQQLIKALEDLPDDMIVIMVETDVVNPWYVPVGCMNMFMSPFERTSSDFIDLFTVGYVVRQNLVLERKSEISDVLVWKETDELNGHTILTVKYLKMFIRDVRPHAVVFVQGEYHDGKWDHVPAEDCLVVDYNLANGLIGSQVVDDDASVVKPPSEIDPDWVKALLIRL